MAFIYTQNLRFGHLLRPGSGSRSWSDKKGSDPTRSGSATIVSPSLAVLPGPKKVSLPLQPRNHGHFDPFHGNIPHFLLLHSFFDLRVYIYAKIFSTGRFIMNSQTVFMIILFKNCLCCGK
jgi:hypothetical protein